jgi:uncharacterized protein YdgA (DUF945 family)
MNKKLVSILTLVVILAAVWIGASAYVGFKAQHELAVITNPPLGTTPFRFSNVTHDRGLLISNGSMIVHYPDPDADQQSPSDLFQVQINYTIDHRVMLTHLSTYELTANLIGDGAQAMTALFGQNPILTGQGRWGWDGQALNQYALPALKSEQTDFTFEMSPINGQFKIKQAELDFEMSLASLLMADANGETRISDVQVTLMTKDRDTGQGRSVFTIGQVDFPVGQAQAVRVVGESVYEGDRLNVSIGKAVGFLTIAGTTASNLKLDILLEGLYAKSMASLSAVMNGAGNLEDLTPAQQQTVKEAIRDLIVHGFSVGIIDMQAATNDGVAKASAMLQVKPNAPASKNLTFDAAKQLVFNANLDLEGSAISPSLTAIGTMMGVIVERQNGFTGSVSLDQGQLVINGINVPFEAEAAQISANITEFLKTP